jgi:hypothetical protein
MAQISRSLEPKNELFVNRFQSGLYTNRGPLYTPISALGLQVITRQDTLWDGLNVQITPQFTLRRRYGTSKACSVSFGASEFPLAYFSFQNLSGTVTPIVDTQTNVYTFSSSSKSSIYSKAVGSTQSSFNSVGNIVYWVDGINANKWNGTAVTNMGIVAPTITPSLSFASGSLSPTVGFQYVYVFKNSSTGHISTASSPSASTGVQTSKNITVGANGSGDGQVDKIDIYRTKDGGATYFFLAEIANPGTGSWTYTDSTADSSLNTLLIAPVAFANNPPPVGLSLLTWYAGRLWGASGNTLYFSGGPDTINGVGTEAWPPANNFAVPGPITALASTSQGLVVFTVDDAYVVTGTTATTFTVPILWQSNWGVASQNSVTQDGDTLYIFTSKGQLFSASQANGIQEIGYAIQQKLTAITPASAYLTIHKSGGDEGVFLSDGSTKIWRYSNITSSWDPAMGIVGGVNAIASIEIAAGNWSLLVGRASGLGYILKRDVTQFADDGSSYTAFATIGSLTVAPPRQITTVSSVLLQAVRIGTYPTISVMLNEITDLGFVPATFTVLPNPVQDPPGLPESSSLWTMRHDIGGADVPLANGYVQHLQLKISFIAENAASEIYAFGLA